MGSVRILIILLYIICFPGTITGQFCIEDKLNENCEYMKCDHGRYRKMPGCQPGLAHGKSSFVCIYITDPDACIPQSGLVTDKSKFTYFSIKQKHFCKDYYCKPFKNILYFVFINSLK